MTGSSETFVQLSLAYKILIDEKKRRVYDTHYLKNFPAEFNAKNIIPSNSKIILEEKRIVFPNSMTTLARNGLLRVGLRNKDRKKYSGIHHDVSILIREKEIQSGVIAKIPLTVRILCPQCMGSNVHCESCGGKGNYKGTRILDIKLEPALIQNGRIFELELGKFRPDKFVHFKKKILKVKLEIITD